MAMPPPPREPFRPERVVVPPSAGSADTQWVINDIQVVHIITEPILREMYAARGERVVGRKIRQMRRRYVHNFGGKLAHAGVKRLRRHRVKHRMLKGNHL
jgi:hypothetical protein